MSERQEWKNTQSILNKLVQYGFAAEDATRTFSWKDEAGKSWYKTCYVWTKEGREACFRWRYSTPMSWAEEMYHKRVRHCVVCGRDCFRKKVWANYGRMVCVCMTCGAKGHGLQDIEQGARQ